MIALPSDDESALSHLDAADTGALLAAAADLVLIVNAADEVQAVAANLEAGLEQVIDQWRGRALRELVDAGSRAALRNLLNAARARRRGLRQLLRHPVAGNEDLPIAYLAQAVGEQGRVILMGRDQRELLQLRARVLRERSALERKRRGQQRDEQRDAGMPRDETVTDVSSGTLETRLVALLEQLNEAVVLTDAHGVIAWSNDSFRRMLGDETGAALDGQALTDYLQCEHLGLAHVLANLHRHAAGQTLRGVLRRRGGQSDAVNVSITSMLADAHTGVGFVLRVLADDAAPAAMSEQDVFRSAEQLTDLVGKVPLKGMVRDATDRVEKMCIEAALRLTGNNRALAAKVLGMSRQGLYQKLHQFQLLDSDDSPGEALDER